MYTPPSSYKKQTVKQILIYVGMTATVLTTVFLLILFTLGYRFDRSARTIEQNGLVQLNSIPSGASVTINSARISGTTSTKTTLVPGQHLVTMSREGYHSWQKTVDVVRGSILWLNYVRLIPVNLPVENSISLPAIESSLQSPNKRWYAMAAKEATPTFTLVDIGSDTPESKELVLPETAFTVPEEGAASSLHIESWDDASRYMLVKHTYAENVEWIVVDTEDIASSKNISTIFDVEIKSIQFSPDSNQVLYALMGGDVRKIDIGASTISAPLARNVAEFSIYDRSTLLFTTVPDDGAMGRSVSYLTEGASEPRVLRRFAEDSSLPLHASAGKYFNQTYVAVAYGNTIEVLSGPLPKSDSGDLLSLTTISTISTKEPVNHLSNRTNGRFFVAEHGQGYSVYDIELKKATTTTLRSEGDVPAGELGWLDGYTVWSGVGGTLRLYEFDGANQHDIMPIASGQTPALTSNNRYLYAPTIDEGGAFYLSRVRLVL